MVECRFADELLDIVDLLLDAGLDTSDGVGLGDLLHDREARVDAEDRRGLVGHISCSESGAVLPSLPRIVFRKWWLRRALGGATSFFCPSEIHLLGWM